ncbi:class I SAM-dependent methyltransferase [Bacillus cereus group sp. TH43LC]|uniref:class I SAM-dependent methyltransferase n=1 Tax=Bacillus TaxID=1386 RepID=UPI000BAFE159|nr:MULTISPECIES: class I SAM-dependent methyltransferase [Bacillus cereus group]ASZ20353.1 SAM-dependent methyltransferase [Bacillus cereus]MCU4903215.1 class I SAM-dependent methyltransferase [Bacillus paranthracis]MDA1500145.1 class I SAM-dependent methyltransferase [Bacillus cereus group sp. TH43LC]MDA1787111.1 class I SAM-dependent methyltransferase [Bacillus cereus group sp. BY5-1LC]MDA1862983.1 class I SAM-dependent methyltransferase [Bacillus cereus group sp. BY128LC]
MLKTKAKYKTWIRIYKLLIFWIISLILLLITLLPANLYLRVLSGILAVPFIYIAFILSYSVYQFAAFGGNYQSKIHDLIVAKVNWDGKGKILDIGTGNGSLIIKLAKAFPKSFLTGIDYWGENWGYSEAQCQKNAGIEGGYDKIDFLKASAAELPFTNDEFDLIVSCLTFHEVKDRENKIEVIKEALRVLKPGGEFVFLDLFMDEKIFGDERELLNVLKKHGVSELNGYKLAEEMRLPKLLLNKKVLGNAMILSGRK